MIDINCRYHFVQFVYSLCVQCITHSRWTPSFSQLRFLVLIFRFLNYISWFYIFRLSFGFLHLCTCHRGCFGCSTLHSLMLYLRFAEFWLSFTPWNVIETHQLNGSFCFTFISVTSCNLRTHIPVLFSIHPMHIQVHHPPVLLLPSPLLYRFSIHPMQI